MAIKTYYQDRKTTLTDDVLRTPQGTFDVREVTGVTLHEATANVSGRLPLWIAGGVLIFASMALIQMSSLTIWWGISLGVIGTVLLVCCNLPMSRTFATLIQDSGKQYSICLPRQRADELGQALEDLAEDHFMKLHPRG
ncbi:MAG: hypothetical protein GYB68_09305 [Chloroflexi bacterium]|nr:hypothetical protein [Chloroflexota bacterium]